MTFNELHKELGKGKTFEVTLNKGIEDHETMFDEGCKATISMNHATDDYLCISCNFTNYEEYNKIFYKPNYYDKNGVPCLKVYETCFYPKNKIETVYFDYDCDVEDCFTITEVHANHLFEEYLKEAYDKITYVAWLETKIINMQK
jgi:hypothetical protein